MAEYGGNSDKSRETISVIKDGKLEPVANGAVVQKQSGFNKFVKSIIVEDVRSVCSFILTDVIVPTVKKAIADITVNAIDMALYGKTGVTKPTSNGPKISYGSYWASPKWSQSEPKTQFQIHNSAYDFDTIVFPTRGQAEGVLETMSDVLDARQVVLVGDLYDLAGVETTNYKVNKFGWTNLRGAEVVRKGDGYVINMPKMQEIK